jgi:hypothetical protein
MKNLNHVFKMAICIAGIAFSGNASAQWTTGSSNSISTADDFVGINLPSNVTPYATLHVRDYSATKPAIYVEYAGASEGDLTWRHTDAFQMGTWNQGAQSFTEYMKIHSNGKVKLTKGLYFDETTEDKISLFGNRLGATSMYGMGVSDFNMYFKSSGSYMWLIQENFSASASPAMYINDQGNTALGTKDINNSFRLSVNGKIRAKEIVVETGWADFVFDADYQLRSLADVEDFISREGHLPEIPSAKEVAENGVKVGEMESKLLMKVEELTLYMIELKKENEIMKTQLEELSNR